MPQTKHPSTQAHFPARDRGEKMTRERAIKCSGLNLSFYTFYTEEAIKCETKQRGKKVFISNQLFVTIHTNYFSIIINTFSKNIFQ